MAHPVHTGPIGDEPPFPGDESTAMTYVPSAPPTLAPSAGVITAEGETAGAAAAATAKAMVEARYILAQHRPRNWMNVMTQLIAACKRPSFAAKAEYAMPRWDARQNKEIYITGPTIRFAEEALRCSGNVDIRADVMLDDEQKRIVFVSVLDLESNTNYGRAIVLQKTQERAKLKKGQVALATRTNSEGKLVYIVAATEDELLMKQNAAVSRVIRSDGLRLIPLDIREDALMVAASTRQKENATDPAGAAKRLAFSYYQIGVEAEALEKFLGKRLTAITPTELEGLRQTLMAITEGETTWDEVVALKAADKADPTSDAAAAAAPAGGSLRDRAARRAASTEPGTGASREPGQEG